MAQPPTGPAGSGRAAVPPDSGDEGDDGSSHQLSSRIGDRTRNIDYGPRPPFSCVDQAAFRLPDLAPILTSRAKTTTQQIGRDPDCCGSQTFPVRASPRGRRAPPCPDLVEIRWPSPKYLNTPI
jgi:hypothetical protein